MFSRIGSAAYKKDLTNTKLLCEYLGNPQQKFKSIHVGGTNGKGSVSHMLSAVFQTANFKTGLYTSPHLYDFRERIKINGDMVPECFVVNFVEELKPLIEKVRPSFFEITVAMAFKYFAEQQVDIAIVEVGLGGRLDSTNIIIPNLSIITNIGWDHMNMLGNTLEKIAFEKAGIIKENVPVVIGETTEETKKVFENTAREKHAEIYFAEETFKLQTFNWSGNELQVTYKTELEETFVATDLPGIYQTKNIATVLTAVEILNKGFDGLKKAVPSALLNTKNLTGLHGRWEIIRTNPTVVLDVAHNTDGLQQMMMHIQTVEYSCLHIAFGIVKDKDIDRLLSVLPSEAIYYFSQANIPRALPADELKLAAKAHKLNGDFFENVNTALKTALSTANPDDLIIVCGSIFLVAEVDRALVTQFS